MPLESLSFNFNSYKAMSFLADHNPVCLKVGIMFWALLLATCSSQFMMYVAVAYVSALGDSCCGVASLQLVLDGWMYMWGHVLRVVSALRDSSVMCA